MVLGVGGDTAGSARSLVYSAAQRHAHACVCAANLVQFFMHRSLDDVVVHSLLRDTVLIGRIRVRYFFPVLIF